MSINSWLLELLPVFKTVESFRPFLHLSVVRLSNGERTTSSGSYRNWGFHSSGTLEFWENLRCVGGESPLSLDNMMEEVIQC